MVSIRANLRINLAYYLRARHVTQKQLAERLGISQAAVNNWIKGKNAPDLDMIPSICEYLEVPMNDLLGYGNVTQLSPEDQVILQQFHKKKDLQKAVHILLDIKH